MSGVLEGDALARVDSLVARQHRLVEPLRGKPGVLGLYYRSRHWDGQLLGRHPLMLLESQVELEVVGVVGALGGDRGHLTEHLGGPLRVYHVQLSEQIRVGLLHSGLLPDDHHDGVAQFLLLAVVGHEAEVELLGKVETPPLDLLDGFLSRETRLWSREEYLESRLLLRARVGLRALVEGIGLQEDAETQEVFQIVVEGDETYVPVEERGDLDLGLLEGIYVNHVVCA